MSAVLLTGVYRNTYACDSKPLMMLWQTLTLSAILHDDLKKLFLVLGTYMSFRDMKPYNRMAL